MQRLGPLILRFADFFFDIELINSDLKTVLSSWYIDSCDANETMKLGLVVVLEEGQHWENTFWVDKQLEFIDAVYLRLLDVLWQTFRHVFAEARQTLFLFLAKFFHCCYYYI